MNFQYILLQASIEISVFLYADPLYVAVDWYKYIIYVSGILCRFVFKCASGKVSNICNNSVIS